MLKTRSLYPKILLGTILMILMWSVINPHDLFTWFLEVLPVLIGIVVLTYIYILGFDFLILFIRCFGCTP